ncbi:hypothetical protein AAE02nite_22960 [Adhaeribacter aerolatus]|uniref:histidine kinase n=1 Tax=Adhaeribacter aerolatus TaxID=670289 RepID=A0A512AY29_9BACT|nr:ATP-binding protein [Adhaeribacter aerolatus]GEO04632.1 hypothetical protein AAE02nite_22960 [Adhaeribacter aerolatus]
MKIITKIYLSIGFILLVFVFVTVAYFIQSNKVDNAIDEVLLSTEIIQANSNLQKAVLDAQAGMRGYLLSGKENYVEPYYAGVAEYLIELNILRKLNQSKPANIGYLNQIDQQFNNWNDSIASPLIEAKRNVNAGPKAQQEYNRLYYKTYTREEGKTRIDRIRYFTDLIEKVETRNKKALVGKLKTSQNLTDLLSLGLTVLAVIIGIATALLLGKTIKKRILSMQKLASNLARGNFEMKLTDHDHDELSSLSADMNVMAQKLQNSFAHLKKMNQELDQFAYVVSHDLKAPLRAINNLAEWIDEDIGETTPEIRKNLSLMRGRVHRLENLINGILAYSRIGRTKIEQNTFDLRELLQEITESLAPLPNQKIIIPTEPLQIQTEKILLQQVLVNLISNGLKYNNKPNAEVSVSAELNGKNYLIRVADNGPGIPPEYHEKIFGVFQTIEARDTIESTGIGLAIVKKIIEEKHGAIRVDSEPGQGTTFSFTWPLSQPVVLAPI